MAKKATARPPADIEVLDPATPVSAEQQLVTQDSDVVRSFMGNLGKFFAGAVEIKHQANDILAAAKLRKPPTTLDEDVAVQTELRTAKALGKRNDDYWSITTVLSRLHKATVAGRQSATNLTDEAATILQNHHNTYVREADRKANEERDRLRREEEAKEQARRDEEQRQLEAEAVKREELAVDLSERESVFVTGYVTSGNGEQSAKIARFADPFKSAARLLSLPKIQAAIKARRDAQAIRDQAAAKREEPLFVPAPVVQRQVAKAAGAVDRTTYSAEVFDRDAFLAAALDPRTRLALGIPTSTVMESQTALNEEARSLKEVINRWPGVRLVKKTTTS